MSSSDLVASLPCPFCGSKDVDTHRGTTFRWMVTECGECSAQGPEVRVQTMGDGNPEDWDRKGTAEAIKAWNTRAAA